MQTDSIKKENDTQKEDEHCLAIFLSKGGIGEVILQTPFFKALKTSKPHLHVNVLLHKSNVCVLENNPYVDRIYFYSNFKELLTTISILRNKTFNFIFIFDKSWKVNYLIRFTLKSACFIGFKRRWWESLFLTKKIEYNATKHETSYYLEMLTWLSFKAETAPQLFLKPEDKEFVDTLLTHKADMVCLLPGGARNLGVGDEPFRRWPKKNYQDLVRRLLETGYKILFVGGKSDNQIVDYIISGLESEYHSKITSLCGKLSLVQSGYAIGKAQCVVCHDSGLMHLASCFNPNLICLFGITSPVSLLPQVKGASYLWADEDIYSPSIRILGTTTAKKHLKPIYFTRITVDDVYQEVFSKMSSQNHKK